jgi:hypothetical protein
LCTEFSPVEFFFEAMKRIVANDFGLSQREQRAPGSGDGAPPQRIGR